MKSSISKLIKIFFSLYGWIIFLICGLSAVLLALILPGLNMRKSAVTICSRSIFFLTGIPVKIIGKENLPSSNCVAIANHASYLDGILLKAYLPSRFSYVIKGEMKRVPFAGFLLKRIDSKFVERFKPRERARNMQSLINAAKTGDSLVFFPEGTFTLQPGLNRFKIGAFASARNANAPIVPIVISGTRFILPENTMLPRFGSINIKILKPIKTNHKDYENNKTLIKRARKNMLEILDEPDLMSELT